MTWEFGVCFTVVKEVLWVDVAVQSAEEVLSSDTVTSFIEEGVDEVLWVGIDECEKDTYFWCCVEWTTGVTGYTSSVTYDILRIKTVNKEITHQ